MKALLNILVGLVFGFMLSVIFFSNVIAMNKDNHNKEVNRLCDSLAKQNGVIKRHVCYP